MEEPGRNRLIAGGSHLLILFGLPGLFVTGMLLLLLPDKTAFLENHLRQSVAFQAITYVASILLLALFTAAGLDIVSIGGEPWLAANAAMALLVFLELCFLAVAAIAAVQGFLGRDFIYPLLERFRADG
jgi:uncharacterized Tic20 family protein